VKQSRIAPAYAAASLVVDPYLFGVACNYQGGDVLLRNEGFPGWTEIGAGTERPCAAKGVPITVLHELFGSRCRS
jgi:hypothetical protein